MYSLHMIVVFIWAIFLTSLIKSIELEKPSKLLAIFSFIFMSLVIYIGTKIIMFFPQIMRSGMWIHIKLTIFIVVMIINIIFIYFTFFDKKINKKLSIILYWFVVLSFFTMLYLTLFKPF